MFYNACSKIARSWRLRRIAKKARNGIVPRGYSVEEIQEALKETKPHGVTEVFGFCSAKIYDKFGALKMDLGLQSVKEVTTVAAKILADAFLDSAIVVDDFDKHAHGSGSTAETDTDTTLSSQCGTRVSGSQTHGATSNVYKTVGTITATSAFTAIEHGIFDTAAAGNLLDRSIVGTPPTLVTDDEVEWTYQLTINAGG